ncbi:MAG: ABC transporter ATP-binding protein [Cyclobacteriaceae bacterium]|nr:ABC transporter ATP-binding protein [Cyclobacteriaceae bacterium HetDA_MAG_MS6]
MDNQKILQILHESAQLLNVDLDSSVLKSTENLLRKYELDELGEFIRDLTDIGNNNGIVFMKKEIPRKEFELFIENFDSPMLLFLRDGEDIFPSIINTNSKKRKDITILYPNTKIKEDFKGISEDQILRNAKGEIIFLSVFSYQSVVGSDMSDSDENQNLSPVTRLFRLLAADKRDIIYVYIYAVIIGVSSLVLPLGIQAAIELISGGVFFSSIYFLIAIIIIGVLGAGILQVLQISIVEYLQRRVFTKAAFEFAYRVPRIKMEAVLHLHFPELMNRFFDVLTIQKGLPKLLIDLSTGIIQILFGLLLLSFYHPFFVFFGLILIIILFLIFYTTGPKGLKSSIIESKFKYKAVYWLEELARALYSFKLSGSTDLPIKKTDYFVNNYLKNRKNHFQVLISQYSYVLLFKAVVTAGLLIIGTVLVVQREITLGQFVASEVIIILILNSVEKIIMYMDVVYDMLTAVDKIAHVTDLPLEKTGGIDIPLNGAAPCEGLEIQARNLSYYYPGTKKPSIRDINISIPKGQRVCISGIGGSGKTTLTNTIAGMYSDFEGSVTYNKYSLRDLDRVHLRDRIGKNVSTDDIFEGTILENILVGKPFADEMRAIEALEVVGLQDVINSLPDGLDTTMLSSGKGYSETFIQKLILARCLAKKPNVLILNDFFNNFPKHERLQLIQTLTEEKNPWTLIVVSNDPLIMAACDRVLYLKDGTIFADGSFDQVLAEDEIVKNIN